MIPTARLIAALTAQRWPAPTPDCNCDTCRHSRNAAAIRAGLVSDDGLAAIAKRLWNIPGIYQKPPAYIDYDCHEELHRAVYAIRWGGETEKEKATGQMSLF
jgi:hypothetical protein